LPHSSQVTMAITETIPIIRTDILVDTVVLEEYEDDEEQPTTAKITKYIEAKLGADLAIRYRVCQKPKVDFQIDFLLDGKRVHAEVVPLTKFTTTTN
jgi:hypothetical protein